MLVKSENEKEIKFGNKGNGDIHRYFTIEFGYGCYWR